MKNRIKYLYLLLVIIALIGTLFPLIIISLQLFETTTTSLSIMSFMQNPKDDIITRIAFDLARDNIDFANMSIRIILPLIAYPISIICLILSLILILSNKLKGLVIILVMITSSFLIYFGISIQFLPNVLMNDLNDILISYIVSLDNLSLLGDLLGELGGLDNLDGLLGNLDGLGDIGGILSHLDGLDNVGDIGGLLPHLDGLDNVGNWFSIDLANILEIDLGVGYWITLIASILLLVLLIITSIVGQPKTKVEHTS